MAPQPATDLRRLARAVERLLPCWRDPERYFERRGEIAERLRELARTIERAPT